jgi:hypothetical protein
MGSPWLRCSREAYVGIPFAAKHDCGVQTIISDCKNWLARERSPIVVDPEPRSPVPLNPRAAVRQAKLRVSAAAEASE